MKFLLEHTGITHKRAFTPKELLLLQILTATVLFGRAWQHLFWDIPFRALLWDEELITPIVQLFGLNWEDYISNLTIAYWQEITMQTIGVFHILLAVLVFFVKKDRIWIKRLLWVGGFFLFCLTLLYWKEHFYRIGQLIEYTIQWSIPIFLIYAIYHQENTTTFRFWLKIAIALTFVGHGLYAFGYYPTPGNFIQMVLDTFMLNDKDAATFLTVIGVIDFAIAIGLFLPYVWKISIIYCIVWGFATAFARIIANYDVMMPLESLHQWLYETIYRLSHGGIPLLLWLLCLKRDSSVEE